MTCNKYLEMALEEIDGELEESRSLLLMRHLVSCESCRMYYERHLRLFDMMGEEIARDSLAVPEDFSSSVMAGIEQDISPAVQFPDYKPSLFSIIISKIKSLAFAPPSLYPIAAMSVLLIVVVTGLRYEKTGLKDTLDLPLTNAGLIKAETVNKKILKADADRDDLSYYLRRHEAKTYSSTGKSISRNAKLVYASYNTGNR